MSDSFMNSSYTTNSGGRVTLNVSNTEEKTGNKEHKKNWWKVVNEWFKKENKIINKKTLAELDFQKLFKFDISTENLQEQLQEYVDSLQITEPELTKQRLIVNEEIRETDPEFERKLRRKRHAENTAEQLEKDYENYVEKINILQRIINRYTGNLSEEEE